MATAPHPPSSSSSNYSYGSPRLINDTANRARYRVPRIISVAVSRGCCIIPRATCPRKVSITRPPSSFFPQISISLSLSSERRTTQQGYRLDYHRERIFTSRSWQLSPVVTQPIEHTSDHLAPDDPHLITIEDSRQRPEVAGIQRA